jgi:hypothetical protein
MDNTKLKDSRPGGNTLYTWLPTNDAADALGISRRTIQRRARAGEIQTRKTGYGTAVEYMVPTDRPGARDSAIEQRTAPGLEAPALVKGRVYVIGCLRACKIGFTTGDPMSRMKSLQTGNPHRLEMVGAVEGERFLEELAHLRFERYRAAGEWFNVNPLDAFMWLKYERKEDQRAWSRGEIVPDVVEVKSADSGILAALERHDRSSVWTRSGLDVVTGYPVDDDSVELLLMRGELHRCERRVRGRQIYLYGVEPFNA